MGRALVVAGAQERVRVAGEPVREAEVLLLASTKLLRPDARAQLRVERPRAPQPLDRRARDVVELEQHRGDERARCPVEQLVRRGLDAHARGALDALVVARGEADAELAGRVGEIVSMIGPAQLDGRAEHPQRVRLSLVALVEPTLARRQSSGRLVDDVGDRVARGTLVPRTAREGLVLLPAEQHAYAFVSRR